MNELTKKLDSIVGKNVSIFIETNAFHGTIFNGKFSYSDQSSFIHMYSNSNTDFIFELDSAKLGEIVDDGNGSLVVWVDDDTCMDVSDETLFTIILDDESVLFFYGE
jgi:hypothetical protein